MYCRILKWIGVIFDNYIGRRIKFEFIIIGVYVYDFIYVFLVKFFVFLLVNKWLN